MTASLSMWEELGATEWGVARLDEWNLCQAVGWDAEHVCGGHHLCHWP
jgi:hypothetical protein